MVAISNKLKVKVKTSKYRKVSSTRWLSRQFNDKYVKQANIEGYRCRAAFKILEIDKKFHIFTKGMKVVDIGSAPGGWSEVVVKKVGKGNIAAIDILLMDSIDGVRFKQVDFNDDGAKEFLFESFSGKVDVVMSDIAPNTTGNTSLDHLQIMTLVENVYNFAVEVLAINGVFIAKVRQGGTEANLLKTIKQKFKSVRHFKPESSRKESSETYIVAIGFLG